MIDNTRTFSSQETQFSKEIVPNFKTVLNTLPFPLERGFLIMEFLNRVPEELTNPAIIERLNLLPHFDTKTLLLNLLKYLCSNFMYI